jgi:hypothetical protein
MPNTTQVGSSCAIVRAPDANNRLIDGRKPFTGGAPSRASRPSRVTSRWPSPAAM